MIFLEPLITTQVAAVAEPTWAVPEIEALEVELMAGLDLAVKVLTQLQILAVVVVALVVAVLRALKVDLADQALL
jgi:hypothetical protein